MRTLFDFKKFSLPNKTTLNEAKCSKWSKDYIPGHHSLQLPITKSGCQQNVKTVIPEKRYFWRRLKSFDKLTTHEVEVSLEKNFYQGILKSLFSKINSLITLSIFVTHSEHYLRDDFISWIFWIFWLQKSPHFHSFSLKGSIPTILVGNWY